MHRLSSVGTLVVAGLFAGCGSTTEPRVPSEIVVSPSLQTAQTVGETVQFSAVVEDANGNALSGYTVTWSSVDLSVATVDADGLATVTGPGQTEIQASAEGVTGSGTLSVELVPAEVNRVQGDGQTAPAFSILPTDPTVRVLDASGNAIPGATVSFSVVSGGGVVSPTSASTDAGGEAATQWTLGPDEGAQVIRAVVGTLEAEFTVTATEPILAVATLSLSDARSTLAYDRTLQAAGGMAPYSWALVGGGLPGGMSLSGGGVLSGTPGSQGSSSFTVRVTDAVGDTASRGLTLRVCDAPLSLSPGESWIENPSGAEGCAPFLPSGSNGDRYRVGVVRTTLSDGLDPGDSGFLAGVNVDVTAFDGGEALAQLMAAPPRFLAQVPPEFAMDLERARATADFHRRMLRDGERLLRELGRDAVLPSPSRAAGTASLLAAMVDPPSRIEIKPYDSTGCSNTASAVPAFLIAFNDDVSIYQDSVQNATSPMDPDHAQAMLDYFDDYGKSTITDYFGGVGDVNTDGRVTVFASPVVGSSVAAFVWPGDFIQATGLNSCAASNEQELVYFNNDVIAGVADDNYQALPVLVHEMKHVSSLFRRLRGNGFHPVWIEEGSAEIAAETSSRMAMAAAGDVARGALLTRDAFPATGIANADRYGVIIRLIRLINSYASPVNSLTDNPQESPDHNFYGTSWQFQRFLGDAYGDAANLNDGALFTQFNDSLTQAGTGGLTAVTGKSTIVLLEEYAVAMMLNGTGAPQPTRAFRTYEFPTATDILRPEFQPEGEYPWPSTGPSPLPFQTDDYVGQLAPGGLRIHDFESDGSGDGIEVRVSLDTGAAGRVVIVRID